MRTTQTLTKPTVSKHWKMVVSHPDSSLTSLTIKKTLN